MDMQSLFGLKTEQKEKVVNDTLVMDVSTLTIATIMNNFKPKEQYTIDIVYIRHIVLDTIRFNVVKFKMNYPDIVLALDSGVSWRRNVAPYYKKKRESDKIESEWDWEHLNSLIGSVYSELIEYLPYKVISVRYAEGDDIIAVVTKYVVSNGKSVMIVAADSDMVQLQKYSGVMQWSPTQKKFVVPKYGCYRNDLRIKIIKGDKKDSIAPIKMRSDYIVTKVDGERSPSIKEKELLALLEADDPTTLLSDEHAKRYKENEILRDFDFIPSDIANRILEEYNAPNKGNRSKMQDYFRTHQLYKMLEKITDF